MTLTALITPFNEDTSIDFASLEKLLDLQFSSEVDGLVLLGTTGEAPTLLDLEKLQLISFVLNYKQKLASNKQIWLGASDNSTQRVVDKLATFNDLAIDGYLISSPWYNKPNQEGLYQHFVACSGATKKSIILYNVPSRTGVNILPATVLKIAQNCPNIRYLKDATGNLEQMMQTYNLLLQKELEGRMQILSGDDALTLAMCKLGAVGVVSVLSNLLPNEVSQLALNQDMDLHYSLLEKMQACFVDTNPIPIKNMLFEQKIIATNQVRLPLVRFIN
jgi:4-hydroxy-tetrahydrodipicolinate synthase